MATGPAERRSLAELTSDWWNKLSRELKLAVAVTALAVVAVAGYMLATTGQSTTTKVPLLDGAAFTQQERIEALRAFASNGLSGAEISGSMILVPRDREADFLRVLPADAVPGNLDSDLDDYIQNDSWWKSRDEARRQFMMYTARKISREIKLFPEILDASVTVTQPPPMGLRRLGEAKASVTVATLGNQPLSPVRVREIQNLVAHSFSNLEPSRVYVVANVPLQGNGSDPDDGPINTRMAELENEALQTKELYRKTIEHHLRRALAHLPGATVVANVEVKPTHEIYRKIVSYGKGVPVSTQTSSTSEETPVGQGGGGPPGVRTNVDAPPTVPNLGTAAATVATATSSDETTNTVFNNNVIETTLRGQDFEPRLVGVVVNVPRQLLEATTVTGPNGQQQVQEPQTTEQDIVEAITRLNYPGLTPDVVKVVRTTVPDPLPPEEDPTVAWEIVRTYTMELLLALLALAAIIAAVVLARRAPMPSLVRLPIDEDDEVREPEEGLEPSPETSRITKLQESITQMVSEKPEAAAGLIRRWIKQDD